MEEKSYCKKCFKPIENNYLFCPFCGEPVSEISKELKSRQDAVAQLQILTLLIDKVEDPKTLNLIEKLINQYQERL